MSRQEIQTRIRVYPWQRVPEPAGRVSHEYSHGSTRETHGLTCTHAMPYCGPDVAGEDVQEEMPLRTIITSVGLQPSIYQPMPFLTMYGGHTH